MSEILLKRRVPQLLHSLRRYCRGARGCMELLLLSLTVWLQESAAWIAKSVRQEAEITVLTSDCNSLRQTVGTLREEVMRALSMAADCDSLSSTRLLNIQSTYSTETTKVFVRRSIVYVCCSHFCLRVCCVWHS